jgi:hypothetical protein
MIWPRRLRGLFRSDFSSVPTNKGTVESRRFNVAYVYSNESLQLKWYILFKVPDGETGEHALVGEFPKLEGKPNSSHA